jgi:CheY-like chemotaxis protein
MRNRPILFIDDDPRSRELVTAILSGADFEVLSAPDGLSGIELAGTAKPAAIILDMMMPGIDGISTLQRLKADPDLKDIPVIGITASMDVKYTEKAFEAGAQCFLAKPFRPESLLCMVELAVDTARRDTPMQRRRRHPRHPAEVSVRCLVRDGENRNREVLGRTENVSLGGFLLVLPKTVAPGTSVQLGLALPRGIITAKGTVVWRNPEPMGEDQFHHGIRLMGFTENGGLSNYSRYIGQISATATS